MNRTELHQLAQERVLEAQALLDAGYWSGAYYLVGYAVELGLKACILAHVDRTGAIFQDRKFSEKCWTHNIDDLVDLAELRIERALALSRSPVFTLKWQVVRDWNESARYVHWTEPQARELFEAVTEPADGVLSWIMAHW